MSKQLAFAVLIEGSLMLLTMLFLTQPRMLFRLESDRMRQVVTMSGLVLLCITFCWSVIFGCVIAIHQLTFRI